MLCYRCGWCCCWLTVVIVDDPAKGLVEGNLVTHFGRGEPCQHLGGTEEEGFHCEVHDEDWYPYTPCYAHDQIAPGHQNGDDAPCRMGVFRMEERKGHERKIQAHVR